MAFTRSTDDLDIIQALSDTPNNIDGLSAAQLKAKFDEASGLLQTFLNSTLIAELEATGASANIGCTGGYTKLQDFIDAIELAGSGSIPPDGTITTPKFASGSYSTDTGLAEDSDTVVASQKAIKTYADTKVPSTYLDADGTLTANSDTKIATQKATKTYADTKIASSLLTTQGDLLIRGASINERLPVGTAYKHLGVNSAGTDLEYQETPNSVLTNAGDILYADAPNSLVRLAKGSANHYLRMNSGATAPEWDAGVQITSGSYVGDNTTNRTITIGFTPIMLILICNGFGSVNVSNLGFRVEAGSTGVISAAVEEIGTLTTNGFIVDYHTSGDTNDSGVTYKYYAIG